MLFWYLTALQSYDDEEPLYVLGHTAFPLVARQVNAAKTQPPLMYHTKDTCHDDPPSHIVPTPAQPIPVAVH